MVHRITRSILTALLLVNTATAQCLQSPPEPILKETIGSSLESNAFLKDAIQIVSVGSNSDQSKNVTFAVNQLWSQEGIPMISVSYPGGNQGETVCDMQTGLGYEPGLVEFNSTTEYTAQCVLGYAEVSVYLFVGNLNDFNIEECESCAAPDTKNYVGYYLQLSCESICEEEETTTQSPTEAPTEGIAELTSLCLEDITVLHLIGKTEFPVDQAVQIVSQNTSTVTVKLTQAWTSDHSIENIYAAYKTSTFSEHCYGYSRVQSGAIFDAQLTMTCSTLVPSTVLEICLADDIDHGFLSASDNATVPKCCEASFPTGTPAVCYTLKINCKTECTDESQQRKLRPSKSFLR